MFDQFNDYTSNNNDTSSTGPASATSDEELFQLLGFIPTTFPALIFCFLHFFLALPLIIITHKTNCKFMYNTLSISIQLIIAYALRVAMIEKYLSVEYMFSIPLILGAPNAIADISYTVLKQILIIQVTIKNNNNTSDETSAINIPFFTDNTGQFISKRIHRFFWITYVIAALVQGVGGGFFLILAGQSNVHIGVKMMIAGLAFQLFFFTGLFGLLLFYVYFIHRKTLLIQSTTILADHSIYDLQLLNSVFFVLFSTYLLYSIRNIYRFILFLQGWDAYLATHEEYEYLFDAVLTFLCLVLYCVFHFGLSLPSTAIIKVKIEADGEDREYSEIQEVPINPITEEEREAEAAEVEPKKHLLVNW